MEKVKVIQERLKMEQSRQKSYLDFRRRSLEFKVDDCVYFKVFNPWMVYEAWKEWET